MINSRQRKQRTQEPERDGTGRKGSVVGVQGAEEAGVAGVWWNGRRRMTQSLEGSLGVFMQSKIAGGNWVETWCDQSWLFYWNHTLLCRMIQKGTRGGRWTDQEAICYCNVFNEKWEWLESGRWPWKGQEADLFKTVVQICLALLFHPPNIKSTSKVWLLHLWNMSNPITSYHPLLFCLNPSPHRLSSGLLLLFLDLPLIPLHSGPIKPWIRLGHSS